jgi:ADP-heptose:LPS heptosyltransferase
MKKALVVRIGAFGDMIVISPVIQALFDLGYEITLYTGWRGEEVYRHDPRVKEIKRHREEIKDSDEFLKAIEDAKKASPHDYFVNLTGSIEHNVALHPTMPEYVYPKYERARIADKNYYEEALRFAKEKAEGDIPDLSAAKPTGTFYFKPEEAEDLKKYIKTDMHNVLWCLSGSGCNKVYPWTEYVIQEVINKNPYVHFITVGDKKCQILGNYNDFLPKENVTELAGEISMRQSCILTSMVDLVVAPDTGVLHASGCFETPKIGLLGHTTRTNITKHFKSDFSLESECPCAPCFYLIYNHNIQCPLDFVSHAPWCMAIGMNGEKLRDRILEVCNGRK